MLRFIARDLGFAVRLFRRSPAFTTAAVTTLGLTIGVSVAVFSVVKAALLEPLPFPTPGRLALVSRTARSHGEIHTGTSVDGRTWEILRRGHPGLDVAVFSSWTSGANLATTSRSGVETGPSREDQLTFR